MWFCPPGKQLGQMRVQQKGGLKVLFCNGWYLSETTSQLCLATYQDPGPSLVS